MDTSLKLTYSSSLSDIVSCDDSFDLGKMRIAYHGANNNRTYIGKDAFERNVHTMYNKPVVANYIRDEDTIGGHDMEVVRHDNKIDLVNATHPVGVVPESANYWWETVEEDDGSEHEYLCTDVLLWRRQEAYRAIKENGITAESMEIDITAGHKDGGIYYIDDFQFLAFCLLGNVSPCFESASVSVYSASDFASELRSMLAEVPSALKKYEREVSNQVMNRKLILMEQYGLSLSDLDFEISEFSLEELEEKFKAVGKIAKYDGDDPEEVVEEPGSETGGETGGDNTGGDVTGNDNTGGENTGGDTSGGSGSGDSGSGGDTGSGSGSGGAGESGTGSESGSSGGDAGSGSGGSTSGSDTGSTSGSDSGSGEGSGSSDPVVVDDGDDDGVAKDANGKKKFALYAGELFNELSRILHGVKSSDGCCGRFWLIDIDTDNQFVFCDDWEAGYPVRMNYAVSGDVVSIDFNSIRRVKCSFVDFDDGDTQVVDLTDQFSQLVESVKESVSGKYELQVAEMQSELDTLRQFKANIDARERKNAEDAIFAKFSDLSAYDEFITLRGDCGQFSLDDLEEKCFAIRGKHIRMDFSLNAKRGVVLPVGAAGKGIDNDPYGGLIEKYSKK